MNTFHVLLTRIPSLSVPVTKHIPLLQITLSELIEPIRADGRDAAEDDKATRAAKGQITLIFYCIETPSRGHIPVKRKTREVDIHDELRLITHCRYGNDTANST